MTSEIKYHNQWKILLKWPSVSFELLQREKFWKIKHKNQQYISD